MSALGEAAPGSANPFLEVLVAGSPMNRSVQSVMVEDHDRLIDKAVVEVLDLERVCSDFVREGQEIRIDLGWGGEHGVIFEGVVRKLEFETSPKGAQRLVTITAYDLSYKMMNMPPRSKDHEGKLSEIVTAIASEHGIVVGTITPDPDPAFTKDKPLRQVNKSDWQFIQDLTLAYGGRAFVEYNDDASKLYFLSEKALMKQDALGTLKLCRGVSQIKQFKAERVAAWAAMQRVAATVDPQTGVVTELPPIPPSAPLPPASPGAGTAASLAKELGSGAESRYNAAAQIAAEAKGNPADQLPKGRTAGLPSDPELLAHLSRTDPTRVSGYRGEGVANGTIMLRAKGKVELQGLSSWADGDWYVNKAIHTIRGGSYDLKEHVSRGATYETQFVVTR